MVRWLWLVPAGGCAASDLVVTLDAEPVEVAEGATALVEVYGEVVSGIQDAAPTRLAYDLVNLAGLPDEVRVTLPEEPYLLVEGATRPEDVAYLVQVEADVDASGHVCGPGDLFGRESMGMPGVRVTVRLDASGRSCPE